MTPELREEIEDEIRSLCLRDKDGRPYLKWYWDYRDELDDSLVEKFLSSDDPELEFYSWMTDITTDVSIDYDMCCEVTKNLVDRGVTDDLDEEDVRDVFCLMGGYVDYDESHFLDQNICVNLVLDTGDCNYDFTLNTPIRNYWYRDSTTFDDDSSLLWLVRQQGYRKSEIVKALKAQNGYPEDKFLRSVVEEIENAPNMMNEVVFLVSMTLRKWFELRREFKQEEAGTVKYYPRQSRGRGYIVLDKGVTCGLYNPWNGGGSLLNIKLSHDVKLPLRYIHWYGYDGEQGYSIQSIWGCGKDLWVDGLKEIHPMKKKLEKKDGKDRIPEVAG